MTAFRLFVVGSCSMRISSSTMRSLCSRSAFAKEFVSSFGMLPLFMLSPRISFITTPILDFPSPPLPMMRSIFCAAVEDIMQYPMYSCKVSTSYGSRSSFTNLIQFSGTFASSPVYTTGSLFRQNSFSSVQWESEMLSVPFAKLIRSSSTRSSSARASIFRFSTILEAV